MVQEKAILKQELVSSTTCLTQIARHGNIDLAINAKGDLDTDEHHTIEDVGISFR